VVFALGLVTIELGHSTHHGGDREGGRREEEEGGRGNLGRLNMLRKAGGRRADACAGWQLARTIEGGEPWGPCF